MGNCCGSPSTMDHPQPTYGRATVGPGYTLGGTRDTPGQVDPRTAAALAAEQRTQVTGKGGKLANQLAADRSKSRQEHLKAAALENRQPTNLQWD